jgi:hypothetical protein
MDSKVSASQESTPPADEQALVHEVVRASRNVLGITLGLLCGVGLFLATLVLVIKGGPDVGAHLSLLNQFFPGYTVTLLGSFVGFFYGFLVGYISGWIVATVYNGVVYFRRR